MAEYYAIDGRLYMLRHEGKRGMHWGERHYQYEDGSLTPLGYIHYGYTKRMKPAVDKAVSGLKSAAKSAGTSVKKAFERGAARRAVKVQAKKDAKVAMKQAFKDAKKAAKDFAKMQKKDNKWASKNASKILKQARKNKEVQKQLKAYDKILTDRLKLGVGKLKTGESPMYNNYMNKMEAQLLNKYVSIKAPSGRAVSFVAMRRERGLYVAVGDTSGYGNGVFADGRSAYSKKQARILNGD